MDTAAKYGFQSYGPPTSAPSQLHSMATPIEGEAARASLTSIHNPLTWFGVLAAFTLGLAAVSTTVRVGPARVSGAVGK